MSHCADSIGLVIYRDFDPSQFTKQDLPHKASIKLLVLTAHGESSDLRRLVREACGTRVMTPQSRQCNPDSDQRYSNNCQAKPLGNDIITVGDTAADALCLND